MVIIHAVIHTMEEHLPLIADGYLRFEQRRITDLGTMQDYQPQDNEPVFDAEGRHLYPGFVDAHTHLGLFGDSLTFEGDDGNEDTDPITPQLRAIDAINPLDGYFAEALAAGITTAVTGPGSANPIAGQMAAIKTYGKRIDNMIVQAPVGMKFALGENPKSTYNDKDQTPVTRMATAALIRETLTKAQRYYREQCRYEQDSDNEDEPEPDMKLAALLPLFRHEMPAHFHVHRADDIFTAVRIAKEFDLDYVLVHATEGHLVTEELTEELSDKHLRGILSGPILTDRSKPELHHQSPKAPGILSAAGIPTAIITDHPETPLPYLLLCAAVAVREGMDREAALRAVTIVPARICGIDQQVGSLAVGKDADIVVYDGDPLDITQRPVAVFINGRQVKSAICDNV